MQPSQHTAPIPTHLREAVEAKLQPDEQIRYLGTQLPWRIARRLWRPAGFGVCWTAFSIFASLNMDGLLVRRAPGPVTLHEIFWTGFIFVFIGIGCFIMSLPLLAARRGARSVCCVTNQRAMIVRVGKGDHVEEWGRDRIGTVVKTALPNNRGDVLFHDGISGSWSDRGADRNTDGFIGVQSPREAEEALLALKRTPS